MSAPSTATQVPSSAPAVAPLVLPPIDTATLPNGLRIVTAQRHDLPLVAVRLILPTGAARDPQGKDGLASLCGELLRRGTTSRTSEQIDDAIEGVGGLLGVDVGFEATSIAAFVPSEHLDVAVAVAGDLARHPRFDDAEFKRAKRREVAQLQQDLDEPSVVAERALLRAFYGAAHPYGHPVEGSPKSIQSLRRTDLVQFHARTYAPQGATLVVVGDVTPQAARAIAEKHLGDWTGPAIQALEVPSPQRVDGLRILLVDKPDATQAQVRMAVPGPARSDPGFPAASVANAVVGGGFTSRLVDEVRVNRGLSYSVGTRVSALRTFGAITLSTFTKTSTVRDILDVSLGVLDGFAKTGPTSDELAKAQRYLIGLYPARVESNDRLAEALSQMTLLGLPFETISIYRDQLAAVTLTEAGREAGRFPRSAGALVVVVGKAADIRGQLQGLGTVVEMKASEAF